MSRGSAVGASRPIISSSLAPLAKYKIVFLGDQSVGKTSIITRFMYDNFDRHYQATIGIDFLSKTMYLEDRTVRLQLWDTAGQERFHTITTSYYRGAMGIILVYDITSQKSFDNITKWLQNIEMHASADVERILIGNKCDWEAKRIVPKDRGAALAHNQNISFLETSAKTNYNIDETFETLAKQILKKVPKKKEEEGVLDLNRQKKVDSGGSKCC